MKNLTNITVYGITSGQASSLFNVTGGSLYVDSLIYGFSTKNILSNYVNTYVNTSLFVFNYNQKHYGTCFNSNNSNISIANSAILYNYGQIGAFAYQSNEISKGTGDIYLENCDLSQNYAYLYGNVSASLPTDANITAAPATRDDEDLGFYFPSFVYVGSSGFMNSSFQVLNLSSSVENYFMFDIVLTDIYNQTLRFDSSTAFNLTAYYPSVDFTTQIEVVFDTLQRVAAFPASALTIPGINTTEVVILNAFYNDLPIQITLNLTTRDCLVGEIYDPATSSCQLCPPEFFSQQVGQSCQNCPAFATCPGGQFIDVLENYWIYPGTTNIYPCLNDGVLRCIGGIDPNNQCSSGYSGALCMGCDFSAGYSQSGANTCSVCADDTLKMMISNGLAFLVSFGIEVLMIYLADKSNKKHLLLLGGKKKELSTEFMIAYDASASTYVFTNLMQLAFLVMIYLSFIETNIIALLDHFQLILYISSSQTQQISNFNCLLINLNYSPEDITYFKVAAGTLLPYVKISVILSFLLFKHYKKPFKDIWGKVWLIVLSILTFDQIGILQSMSNFSTCINGGFQGYSDMDPNISCNSSQFLHFKTTWILPNFVIWALVVPGILIYIFYHFRNNHTNTKVIRIIGGLTTNFSDQGYYWRLVNMLLRLGFLATFTMFTNPKDATVVAFLIMLPYYRLVSKINPYLKEEFQRDEKLSAIVVMISLVCVNQAIDNDDTAVIFYSISIFTMYFLLMGYFALKVFTKFRIQYRLSKEHERTSKISSLDISFSDREEIRDSRTSTISL